MSLPWTSSARSSASPSSWARVAAAGAAASPGPAASVAPVSDPVSVPVVDRGWAERSSSRTSSSAWSPSRPEARQPGRPAPARPRSPGRRTRRRPSPVPGAGGTAGQPQLQSSSDRSASGRTSGRQSTRKPHGCEVLNQLHARGPPPSAGRVSVSPARTSSTLERMPVRWRWPLGQVLWPGPSRPASPRDGRASARSIRRCPGPDRALERMPVENTEGEA